QSIRRPHLLLAGARTAGPGDRPGPRTPAGRGRSRLPRPTGRSSGGRIRRAPERADRKSTRLNSSHVKISYAVFCLKKKKTKGYHIYHFLVEQYYSLASVRRPSE